MCNIPESSNINKRKRKRTRKFPISFSLVSWTAVRRLKISDMVKKEKIKKKWLKNSCNYSLHNLLVTIYASEIDSSYRMRY